MREKTVWIRNSDGRQRKSVPTIFWKEQNQDDLALSTSGENIFIELLERHRKQEILEGSHSGSAVINPTSTRQDTGPIPGLPQCLKNPALQ